MTLNKTLIAVTSILLVFAACNYDSSPNASQVGVNVPTGSIPVGHVSLNVYDPTGALVYSSTNASTALQLTTGVVYNLQLSSTDIPAGTSLTLQSTDIDVVNATPVTSTLVVGNNSYTAPTPGDYLYALSAPALANMTVSADYQASVMCSNPTFTASSLNASGISVAAGSGSNLYNFSASGVTSAANGTGPYLCAWDLDGDGIQDTAFGDCSTGVSNEYVNYVGTRSIGLLVKDACNTTVAVANSVNLAYTVPSMPGNVFIYGQLSSATGSAQTDTRIDNVTYLATNSGGFNNVQPQYTPGANGQGSFTIGSSMNYGQPSSMGFGMQLDVGNISDTLNVSTMTGTVNASAATLNKTVYTTDESGDQEPARSLTGTSCQLTNPGGQVVFQQGTPCSAGTTGDNNSANVEIWGDYLCTVSDSGGSTVITGSFDGIAHLADSCVGGGGGGGGGINPIEL